MALRSGTLAQAKTCCTSLCLPHTLSYKPHHFLIISHPCSHTDETKIVLHQTIDSVLRRGEKLDALVDKSNDLSLASQMFYKQARKTNSCCRFM